jgi:prevent-host-death family protein
MGLATRNLVYTLVVMTTLSLSDAKTQLARLLREADELGERFVITRSGRPAAVLISNEEYEGLLETLEILADPKLTASVRQGLLDAGLTPARPRRDLGWLGPFSHASAARQIHKLDAGPARAARLPGTGNRRGKALQMSLRDLRSGAPGTFGSSTASSPNASK